MSLNVCPKIRLLINLCPVQTGLFLMVSVQLVGLSFGPLALGWRWDPLWGSPHEIAHLWRLVLCHVGGSIALTLWLNLHHSPPRHTTIKTITAVVVVYPLVIVAYAFASNAQYWNPVAIVWALICGGWNMIPLALATPVCLCASAVTLRCIKRARGARV